MHMETFNYGFVPNVHDIIVVLRYFKNTGSISRTKNGQLIELQFIEFSKVYLNKIP